ncbi:MAG: phosphoenolpyruvate--protein phosphotransferase [Deltaproteobacteria bacterium]|nr:phosphoenolpyruvate--protein phosphotransferase [Deltaproteobacteria bacterium]
MKPKTPDRHMRTILEIGKLITGSHELHRVLQGVVSKVSSVMGTDVASLYLLDSARNELVLASTKGLSPQSVGQVRMKIGEGLTSLCVERMRPVAVPDAKRHPRYKFFPETHEEKYRAFLAVPLIDKHRPVGALVVQTRESREFTRDEVNLLSAIATQVVGVVENARLLEQVERSKSESAAPSRPEAKKPATTLLSGLGASEGIGVGQAVNLRRRTKIAADTKRVGNLKAEKRRMVTALRSAERETAETVRRAAKHFSREEIAIFDAYELILKDPTYRDRILEGIDSGLSAPEALQKVTKDYARALAKAEDFYLRERAYDVEDVGARILEYLVGAERKLERARNQRAPEVLFAQTLGVYDLVELDRKRFQAAVTASGAVYSHVAILARAMNFPIVLGVEGLLEQVKAGDRIVVDGTAGLVHVNPQTTVETEYRKAQKEEQALRRKMLGESPVPATTLDSVTVSIGANVGMLSNVREAVLAGVDEIGLYRTEFPFLIRSTTPTEEEQYNIYRKVLEQMEGKPVTLRTLDVGGDKTLSYIGFPTQENPNLGWRSIRVSLEREDLFKIQLRAVFRAALHGKLNLLFPMITRVEEVRRVKEILADVTAELREENVPHERNIPIGAMIEVPGAVHIIDALAREVDFFSIGTNDLVQYTLAVDRNNQKVAPLYDPLHPSVLHLIRLVVESGERNDRLVTVCGEMAGDPLYAAALLALGVRRLSMGASAIPRLKLFIRKIEMKRLRDLGPALLKLDTSSEIRAALKELLPPAD